MLLLKIKFYIRHGNIYILITCLSDLIHNKEPVYKFYKKYNENLEIFFRNNYSTEIE